RSTTWPRSRRARCSTSSTAFRKSSRARRSTSPPPSCRCAARSSVARSVRDSGVPHESIRTADQGRRRARKGSHRAAEGALQPAHAEGHATADESFAAQAHPARHRAHQDHPRAEEEGGDEVTEAATQAKPETNTRTLIGRVVSDKRTKTIT